MSYRPKLPRRVISSGFISNAQFEFIVAAGQPHSRHLPVDQENPGEKPMRAGIFLPDGTGAGKTNAILGTILENGLPHPATTTLVHANLPHRHAFLQPPHKMVSAS